MATEGSVSKTNVVPQWMKPITELMAEMGHEVDLADHDEDDEEAVKKDEEGDANPKP